MLPALILSSIKYITDKISKKSIDKQLEKTPNNTKAFLKSAISNLKSKDYLKASDLFKHIYELEPTNKVSIFYVGLLSLRLNRFEDTKIFFTKYLAEPITKPQGDIESEIYYLLPESYYYLGYAYSKLNDIQKADEFKNKAISINKRVSKLTLF